MPPETRVTNSTPASSFALATTAFSQRLSIPWLQIVTFLYTRCDPWKNPMQSSTVLLEYFWLTSSTTGIASVGKYSIVRVGKGIGAVDDVDSSSPANFICASACDYILIST